MPNRQRSLREAVQSGGIREPRSRSKSDWTIKLVVICQIAWFALQAFFRAIQHVQVTALEIMTVAFVFCSFVIYGLCWHQPQDVEYPIIMQKDKEGLVSNKALEQNDPKLLDDQETYVERHEASDPDSARRYMLQRRRSWPRSKYGFEIGRAYKDGLLDLLALNADHLSCPSILWNTGHMSRAHKSSSIVQPHLRRDALPLKAS